RAVRRTRRRISSASSPSPTVTCRPRISRTDTFFSLSVGGRGGKRVVDGDIDVHVFPLNADGIDGHRLGGRQVGGFAGAQVEARPVQPALHGGRALELLDVTLAERQDRTS